MLIFKDIITGDELFTDAQKYEEFMGAFYKVYGKTTTRNDDLDPSLFGANPSAEDGDSGAAESSSTQVIDFVDACKLVEAPAYDKKTFMAYFKDYCKHVAEKLTQEGRTDDVTEFKKHATDAMKYIKGNIKAFQIFTGESVDPDGSVGYLDWEDNVPYILFFKHALVEEKV
uniref:Translationally-controlled tumor protein homolog n=2 Tax=Ciona intestinalis TaxID=7719 RepID=A0A1W5B6T4_CIOIN|nr:translationally-controlled tumor protein homolog isoform X1 [Ciona intestinalis]|eukprot:XP_009859052.1 translationally-controlled tumor protein homolog isoform X1 [Ciona intestinalis]